MWEYTFTRRRVGEPARPITSAADAYAQLRDAFEGAETERLVVAALDRKHKPLGRETVYVGTVAGATVRIAELFRMAVRLNASAIVIAHNHPSGDPTPSSEDIRTTRDAIAVGGLLGIEVLDHLVIGEGAGWVSLGELAARKR